MHSLSAPSRWLASELASLLSTPQQGNPSHLAPTAMVDDAVLVDRFTSRFDDVFIRHARGLVSGKEVDREELKRTLLVLGKRWNASNVRYVNCELHYRIEGFHPEMGVKMEFTSSDVPHTIVWEACVIKQRNGRPRIKTLMLEADPELFRPLNATAF